MMLSTDSLNWRIPAVLADVKYALDPPQQAVFIPVVQPTGTAQSAD